MAIPRALHQRGVVRAKRLKVPRLIIIAGHLQCTERTPWRHSRSIPCVDELQCSPSPDTIILGGFQDIRDRRQGDAVRTDPRAVRLHDLGNNDDGLKRSWAAQTQSASTLGSNCWASQLILRTYTAMQPPTSGGP